MTESTKLQEPSRRGWRLVVLAALGVIFWKALSWESPSRAVAAIQPVSADARNRKLALGVWEDQYKGKRTMTLNADGTGTMLVELSGLGATLFVPRLKFNLQWSLEGGRLKEKTLGGEPATQVRMILSTFGDHVDQPILELAEDHLTLLDEDGKTRYYWKRVTGGQ